MTRMQAILTDPKNGWPVIAGKQTMSKDLYVCHILFLAAIGPVAGGTTSGLGSEMFEIPLELAKIIAYLEAV